MAKTLSPAQQAKKAAAEAAAKKAAAAEARAAKKAAAEAAAKKAAAAEARAAKKAAAEAAAKKAAKRGSKAEPAKTQKKKTAKSVENLFTATVTGRAVIEVSGILKSITEDMIVLHRKLPRSSKHVTEHIPMSAVIALNGVEEGEATVATVFRQTTLASYVGTFTQLEGGLISISKADGSSVILNNGNTAGIEVCVTSLENADVADSEEEEEGDDEEGDDEEDDGDEEGDDDGDEEGDDEEGDDDEEDDGDEEGDDDEEDDGDEEGDDEEDDDFEEEDEDD